MPLSLICPTKDPAPWVKAIQAVDPTIDLRVWPEDGDKADITFALVWAQPQGIFSQYPNLQVISSMGAGVDNLLQDTSMPKQATLVRMVDPLPLTMCDSSRPMLSNNSNSSGSRYHHAILTQSPSG